MGVFTVDAGADTLGEGRLVHSPRDDFGEDERTDVECESSIIRKLDHARGIGPFVDGDAGVIAGMIPLPA